MLNPRKAKSFNWQLSMNAIKILRDLTEQDVAVIKS